jgi:DNA polymerase III subunit gamma/tau
VEDILASLRGFLKRELRQAWEIGLAEGSAQPSLREQELAAREELRQRVLDTPLVKAAMEAFPDAELAAYTIDEQRSG